MKRRLLTCVFVGALLLPACAHTQTTTAPSVNRDRPRSSYDPGAVASDRRPQQPGGVTSALGKINPCDSNYGFALDEAHIAFYQETLHNFLWWTLLVVTCGFVLSFAYIFWLRYQQELLLDMSSHMIAQLFNAHHVSWDISDKRTKDYNALMRRFNAHVEAERATAKEAEKQAAANAGVRTTGTADTLTTPLATRQTQSTPMPMQLLDAEPNQDAPPANPGEPGEGAFIVQPVAQSGAPAQNEDQAALDRWAARAKAQDQKISNLRAQLNKAHDQLTKLSQQKAS